jgi:hypothetical protein
MVVGLLLAGTVTDSLGSYLTFKLRTYEFVTFGSDTKWIKMALGDRVNKDSRVKWILEEEFKSHLMLIYRR